MKQDEYLASRPAANRVCLAAVIALALLVRLWALWSLHFDGLYGQDSYAYYYHGVELWRAHSLSYPWPWLPSPLHLYWPLGEPVLVAAATALAGTSSAYAALAVSVAAGLGVVALTHLLAFRVAQSLFKGTWSTVIATLAALLIGLAGLEVQASGTIMADAPALFWAMCAAWLWTTPWVELPQQHRLGISFLAGTCFALAVSTRLEYAPLGVAFALYWLAQRGRSGVRPAVAALLGVAVAAVPLLLSTVSYSNPVVHQQWLTSWSIQHYWQTRFFTADGLQHYPMSVGEFYLLRPLVAPQSLPFLLAPFVPAAILALAGGIRMTRRSHGYVPNAGPLLLLLLAWWLVPALYLSGVPFESARFALIYAPPLAILEAVGLAATVRYLLSAWRPALPGALVLAILGLGILAVDIRRPLAALADGKTGDLSAVHWLAGHAPPGATLVTFSLTLTLYHYGDLRGHGWTLVDLSALTPGDLRRLVRTRPLVVVADEQNLGTQWTGLPPDAAFDWLMAHAHLRSVAQVGAYTVWQA